MTATFRIATFNLESLDDASESTSLAARIAVLRPQLLRLAADILCLQEVNGQRDAAHAPRGLRALDMLLEGTPYAAFERASTTGRDGVGALDVHNLVILSRFPLKRSDQIHHQLVAAPRYFLSTAEPGGEVPLSVCWDRPLLHADIELGDGRRLHVLNVHLRAPLAAVVPGQKTGAFSWKSTAGWAEGFFVATIKRNGQALEARLLVDRLFDADPRALIVLCGDINAGLDEMPVRILRGNPADTGSLGLATRALAPAEGPQRPDQHFSVRHGSRGFMFDHILVSRELATCCRHAEAYNEELIDELTPGAAARPESFHAPVVAEFALPKREQDSC